MQWEKLGLLHVPNGTLPWARTHAMLPTPMMLPDGALRLYIAHADDSMVCRIGYVDLALRDPTRVIDTAQRPVLETGEPGNFDDNGVVPGCVIQLGGQLALFYSGFQKQTKIPYTIFSGLARSDRGTDVFVRTADTPILDRREGERFFRAAPMVLQDGSRWRLWYIGGSGWVDWGGKLLPSYSLRHIESANAKTWTAPSTECLAPDSTAGEIGFGRPFVIKDGATYRMWYSIRRRTGYGLGYATSSDGLAWSRRDGEVGIGPSESGWDSEMICYAAIVPGKDRWLMFYNGNGYGRTGVGVAELASM
jgi:predicted GH43/DUF377 family glycosyl hydrolase